MIKQQQKEGDNMNIKEFTTRANKARLANKNAWVYLNEIVNGKEIQYKAFGNWVQSIEAGKFKDGSSMGLNVSEFKEYITDTLEYIDADKYNQV